MQLPSSTTARTLPAVSARMARGARALALAASTLWLLGACCNSLDEDCVDDTGGDAGPRPPACDAAAGACAIANCDVATIRTNDNGETCATCPSDEGTTEVCGFPVTARCESRENSRGEGCSICATELGEILYDSCFTDQQGTDGLNCERSEQAIDPDAPQGEPGAEELVCETCTNGFGEVVSVTCEPASDACVIVPNDSGLECRVCTRDGEVVVNACEQPDISPRSCEAYASELGRCVDCFGDNDELLTHFCTLAEDTFISCTDSVTPEGLLCTSCFDQNGTQIDRFCDFVDPTLQQCALLDYSEQSCVVCLGVDGFPAIVQCNRKGCENPDDVESCPSPPDCEFNFGENGELCRTCPNDAFDAFETQCVLETNLHCEEVFDDNTRGFCLSCKDIGRSIEVFRRCENGSLPPTCFEQDDGTGSGALCEVCVDSATGEQVYATCPPQTCYDVGDYNLVGVQGNTLFVDNQPAVADCQECAATSEGGGTNADDSQALCTLRSDCGPVDLTSPDAACEGTVVFAMRPRVCENPWESAGFQSGYQRTALELLDIMSFALDIGGVAVVGVQSKGADPNAPPDPECVEQCACLRGDLLEIVVLPDNAAGIVELFDGVLDRCSTNADCREGTACRLDGGCG